MNQERANQFAQEWIEAWNSHDLNRILSHYAEPLEFYSPFISLLQFNATGKITNKNDLYHYFKKGLENYPDLHFDLHHCLAGVSSFVLYYTSVKDRLAAEVFELNEQGLAFRIHCHYTNPL